MNFNVNELPERVFKLLGIKQHNKSSTQSKANKMIKIKTTPISRKKNNTGDSVKKENPVIKRLEDLANYNKVISSTNKRKTKKSGVYINPDCNDNYIVMESKDTKSVAILCNEKLISLPVDNNYLTIAASCRALSYKINKYYVSQNIINIIHSNYMEVNTDSEIEESGPYHDAIYELIASAKKSGTSDIHIEVRRETANIYFRINSDRTHHDEMTAVMGENMARIAYQSFCKNQDINFNPDIPQDAMMEVTKNGETTYVRLGTIKEVDGFDMSLRILSGASKKTEFKHLTSHGYSKEQVFLIEIALAIPIGVIIISGVTNSGKTTSLASLVGNKSIEHNNKIKIITIENPVENIMQNITQVPITTKIADTNSGISPFAIYMKAALRQDPDVLMPGEIRDEDSAKLLVDATESGHQVLTTLHAPSGIGGINRLREMGISGSVLGSSDFLAGMIHQSLVRINCDNCSLTIDDYLKENNSSKSEQLIQRIKNVLNKNESYDLSKVRFENKNGCKKCNNKGVKGIEVIAEVIIPDAKMKALFRQGKDVEAANYYKESGGKFMIDHGLDKLFKGMIDPSFLERKVGMLDMSEVPLKEILERARKETSENSELINSKSGNEDDALISDNNLDVKSSLKLDSDKNNNNITQIN